MFRYAMTSAAKLDGGSLTHLAMEEMRPPELDYVVSQDKAGNPYRAFARRRRRISGKPTPRGYH